MAADEELVVPFAKEQARPSEFLLSVAEWPAVQVTSFPCDLCLSPLQTGLLPFSLQGGSSPNSEVAPIGQVSLPG